MKLGVPRALDGLLGGLIGVALPGFFRAVLTAGLIVLIGFGGVLGEEGGHGTVKFPVGQVGEAEISGPVDSRRVTSHEPPARMAMTTQVQPSVVQGSGMMSELPMVPHCGGSGAPGEYSPRPFSWFVVPGFIRAEACIPWALPETPTA